MRLILLHISGYIRPWPRRTYKDMPSIHCQQLRPVLIIQSACGNRLNTGYRFERQPYVRSTGITEMVIQPSTGLIRHLSIYRHRIMEKVNLTSLENHFHTER